MGIIVQCLLTYPCNFALCVELIDKVRLPIVQIYSVCMYLKKRADFIQGTDHAFYLVDNGVGRIADIA